MLTNVGSLPGFHTTSTRFTVLHRTKVEREVSSELNPFFTRLSVEQDRWLMGETQCLLIVVRHCPFNSI